MSYPTVPMNMQRITPIRVNVYVNMLGRYGRFFYDVIVDMLTSLISFIFLGIFYGKKIMNNNMTNKKPYEFIFFSFQYISLIMNLKYSTPTPTPNPF